LIITTFLQHFFPRNTNTYGYNLPKMHGITEMQEYLMLFGDGNNFYGGPGESAHKQFIKIPGQRTQRRVSEFAQKTALQYYNMLFPVMLCMTVRCNPIFTNNQEMLTQILTLLNQKETLSLKCQESMILTLSCLGAPLVCHVAFSAHISLKNGPIRIISSRKVLIDIFAM
jgi:hypothetical protein